MIRKDLVRRPVLDRRAHDLKDEIAAAQAATEDKTK